MHRAGAGVAGEAAAAAATAPLEVTSRGGAQRGRQLIVDAELCSALVLVLALDQALAAAAAGVHGLGRMHNRATWRLNKLYSALIWRAAFEFGPAQRLLSLLPFLSVRARICVRVEMQSTRASSLLFPLGWSRSALGLCRRTGARGPLSPLPDTQRALWPSGQGEGPRVPLGVPLLGRRGSCPWRRFCGTCSCLGRPVPPELRALFFLLSPLAATTFLVSPAHGRGTGTGTGLEKIFSPSVSTQRGETSPAGARCHLVVEPLLCSGSGLASLRLLLAETQGKCTQGEIYVTCDVPRKWRRQELALRCAPDGKKDLPPVAGRRGGAGHEWQSEFNFALERARTEGEGRACFKSRQCLKCDDSNRGGLSFTNSQRLYSHLCGAFSAAPEATPACPHVPHQ